MLNSLKGAKNIGPAILRHLNEVGIYSLEQLAKITPVKTYLQISEQNPGKTFPVCYYLYSLQGAILNLKWNRLPEQLKKDLLIKAGKERAFKKKKK